MERIIATKFVHFGFSSLNMRFVSHYILSDCIHRYPIRIYKILRNTVLYWKFVVYVFDFWDTKYALMAFIGFLFIL